MRIELLLYAVRNHEGKWFRSVGYGGGGRTWVDELKGAKIYAKIGQARGRVTFFANSRKELPIPELVELSVTGARILNEDDRVKASMNKKKLAAQSRKVHENLRKIAEAERQKASAEAEIRRLKGR